ncbi:MAG: hypothetical protein WCT45_02620 [Candidatus Paceibacterota bacterium]|jgi:hypothetical protein
MIPIQTIEAEQLKDKYIFLDNDFLGIIFEDEELLKSSLTFIDGYRVIDGFTRIEFLRDVWLPEIREKKEQFLNSELFFPVSEHQELFKQTRENAIELSRLYAHNNPGRKGGVSTVDLLLAGTLMFYRKSILVTGNKKDFPSCIFDTIGVLNFEQKDGHMRAISFVQFNSDKFEACKLAYAQVPNLNGAH